MGGLLNNVDNWVDIVAQNNNDVIVELYSIFVLMLVVAKWLWLTKSHDDIIAQLQNEAKVIDDTALLSVDVPNNKKRLLNIYIQKGLPLWQIILGNNIKIEVCLCVGSLSHELYWTVWIDFLNSDGQYIRIKLRHIFVSIVYSVFKIYWTVLSFEYNWKYSMMTLQKAH